MSVEFTLNGEKHQVEPAEGESLLTTLRERCDTTSPKDGCSPQGQCGCCLALIDGKPKVTCATPTAKAAGKEIITLEGLSDEERALTAKAFVAAAGLQCGFCIPGIALRAKHLIDKNPEPSRAEIGPRVALFLTSQRAIGFDGHWREANFAPTEEALQSNVGAGSLVVVTNLRALALTPESSGFQTIPMRVDERVENLYARAATAEVHTSERRLIFTDGWSEERRAIE